MKQYISHPFFLILLLFTSIVIAACGAEPQVVEVEVTREVEIIKEVEEEVEEEVAVEVEVIEEVAEEAVEEVEGPVEVEATRELELFSEGKDDPAAVGSEEDDGSPFIPQGVSKTGSSNETDTNGERLAWLTSTEANIGEPTARVLLNHVEDLVIVHTVRNDIIEEQVVLAKSILFYQSSTVSADGSATANLQPDLIYLPLSFNRWFPITEELDLELFSSLAEAQLCVICSDEQYEVVHILTPDQTIVLKLDIEQDEPPLDTFLDLLRNVRSESSVRARATLGRTE